MPEVSLALTISAFIAGILMFLAPCTLPLVPAYLAFISGLKKPNEDLSSSEHRKIIANALAFVVGFSIVFISFGVLAGLFGSFVGQFRVVLSQIGGAFIIAFGLMMLEVISFAPLLKERKISVPTVFTPGEPLSAFVIGLVFALGWTPCVGPVLASVLLLASTTTTVTSGAFLLLVFSLGFALPFIIVALLYGKAASFIDNISGFSKWMSRIGGLFLICIGLLLLTNSFGLTAEYGYKLFGLLGLEGLFDHL